MTRWREARIASGAALAVALGACSPPPVPPSATPVPPEEVYDTSASTFWSVEIHAGEEGTAADEIASRVQSAFDAPVFVDESGGAFRVRVGRFRSRKEAEAFLPIVHEHGHRAASVVRVERAQAQESQ